MVWLALGLGCLWHGIQIVWAAPLPRQFRKAGLVNQALTKDGAFMLFWLDQYAWIGIVLCFIGLGLIASALF